MPECSQVNLIAPSVFLVNLLGVRVFGELEFWFSSIKVITLVGLILMGIIIDLGGNPHHDRYGFRFWKHPYGPMGIYLLSQVHNGHLAIFLGFWSTLTNALFAYIGTELIGVTVGEAQNPSKNIPRAIKRTFWRIVVFYIGGVFVIGLIVPSTDNVGQSRFDESSFISDDPRIGSFCGEQIEDWCCSVTLRRRYYFGGHQGAQPCHQRLYLAFRFECSKLGSVHWLAYALWSGCRG